MKRAIITVIITLTAAALSCAFYSVTASNDISPLEIKFDPALLKDTEKLAKSAVENYLTQGTYESTKIRNEQYSPFFAQNSRVYDTGDFLLTSTVVRSSAKVTDYSTTDPNGEYQIALVKANITLYYEGGKKSSKENIYQVWLSETNDGSFAVYEIGEL